jgi:hypothetical protein
MFRQISTIGALCAALVLPAIAVAAGPPADAAAADKDYVIDGSFTHDVGELWLHVTNWGLIGSQYTTPTTFSDAPSAMWPGGSGINHLWGAGLWIGALRGGVPAVSTGQYEIEILAPPGPEYVLYELSYDTPGAARYPWPMPDDDGDGLEDEDPFNGLDDDGDGLVDEDDAGASDQMFRAEMADDTADAQEFYPDHEPLDVAVVQRSLQWEHDDVDDLVGFEYAITNVGAQTLDDLHVGIFSDFDIAQLHGPPGGALDDLVGFTDATVEAYPGEAVHVQVAHMRDGGGLEPSGWIGWVPLGHPTDPAGQEAPETVSVRAFQRYSGQVPYDQGGDPTNDAQRYESLATPAIDPGSVVPDDYRLLTSIGPFASLAPGETLTVAYALVIGADEEEMLRHAARARLVYEGVALDRDGDPANGAEYVVRWLGPEEMAVSVENPGPGGSEEGETPRVEDVALDAAPNPFNPSLQVACRLPGAGQVRLTVVDARGRHVRTLHDGHHEAGVARWIWDGRDDGGRSLASGAYLLRLETETRVTQRAVTLVK